MSGLGPGSLKSEWGWAIWDVDPGLTWVNVSGWVHTLAKCPKITLVSTQGKLTNVLETFPKCFTKKWQIELLYWTNVFRKMFGKHFPNI